MMVNDLGKSCDPKTRTDQSLSTLHILPSCVHETMELSLSLFFYTDRDSRASKIILPFSQKAVYAAFIFIVHYL